MYLNRPGGASTSPILTLLEKIPQWEETLSSLNNAMDDRQVDLRVAEKHVRENASLKRCGSMETLRPDGDGELDGKGGDSDVTMGDEPQTNGAAPPNLTRSSTSPGPIRYNTRLRKAQAAGESAGDDKAPVLRKRKTESITSVSAMSRKKWNKKEIIVYYQAPVQAAFSSIFDSIKLVGHQIDKVNKAAGGAGRSSILDRHKYAIKSLAAFGPNTGAGAELEDLDAEMTLEADDNIDADFMLEVDSKVGVDGALPDDLEPEIVPGMKTKGTTMPAREADDLPDLEPDTAPEQNGTTIAPIEPDSDTNILLPDSSLPPIEYRSSRKMNPNLATTPYTRHLLAQQSTTRATSAPRVEAMSNPDKPTAEAKADSNAPDIFSELSSNLNSAAEIVQEAAHEFLKWGSCRLEIRKVEALLRKLKLRVERGIREDPSLGQPSSPSQSERGEGALGRWGLSKYGAAFAKLGRLDGDLGDLGDLEADDGMNLEVDDGMVLEADDGMEVDAVEASGDLEVDEMHKVTVTRSSIKSRKSTRSAERSTEQSQYITVIKPDSSMDCSKAGADTTSQSTTSGDAPVTPDELDITSTLKSNMSQRKADLMAKYGGTISSQRGPQRVQPIRWYGYGANKSVVSSRMRKSMDVHEVQISPISRVK